MYNKAIEHNADISVAQMKFFNEDNISDAAMYQDGIVCDCLFDKLLFLRNDNQCFWTSVVNKLFSKNIIKILGENPNPENLNLGEDC